MERGRREIREGVGHSVW